MVDKRVIGEEKAKEISKEGWEIFAKLSRKHTQRLTAEDPIEKFKEILTTLIVQGKVRIENKTGLTLPVLGDDKAELIGFYDDSYLYLLPSASWHAIQRYCINEGTYFSISKTSLYRTLKERRLVESQGDTPTFPVRVRGETYRVLKIRRAGIYEETVTTVTEEEN